jgi:tetratricopeptide (TPR) repeat protein
MSAGRWLLVIAVAAILTAAYWPVFGAGFSPWDDQLYTADNPLVKNGLTLPCVAGSFTSPWENNWSPVFWVFLAAQVSLAGGASAAVFHSVSVLLCLGNAALLFVVARRFSISVLPALVVAALFALHPLRVEAVAWISAQKHLLAATFLLLSLVFYQEASRRNSRGPLLLSLVAYGMSLMSSQIGVGLPVFLFLWEFARGRPGRPEWREALRKSAGFCVLAVGAAIITLWVNWRPSAQSVAWFDHPLPHRILQSFGSLGWQAKTLVWPAGLAGFYPWPSQAIWLYAALGVLVLLGIAWAAWKGWPAGALVVAGLAGFLACFLPVSGVLAIPVEFTADRLSYLPALFLAFALGAVLEESVRRGNRWLVVACGVWALVLAPLTFRQAGYWRNERTIVDRTLSLYPDSVPAQLNDATLAGMEGKPGEALARFREIRASHPLYEVVWSNEMALLGQEGRVEEAAELGMEAVKRIPRSVSLNYKVGVLLTDLRRPKEALVYLRKARELSPQGVQPAYQLARALVGSGEIKEAIPVLDLLELSLQGDPAYWEVRYAAHDRNGDWQKAERAREKAELLRSRQKSGS